ncbi:MAG: hypothetical protein C0179_05130, partial [Fervidicoccus sp.]
MYRRQIKRLEVGMLLIPKEDNDPLTSTGSGSALLSFLKVLYRPLTVNIDPDPNPDCSTITSVTGLSDFCGPVMVLFNKSTNQMAVAFIPSGLTGKAECSGLVNYKGVYPKLRMKGYLCDDTSSRAMYHSLSALDDTSSAYTIDRVIIGVAPQGSSITDLMAVLTPLMYYDLASPFTKGSTDIAYIVYRFGFYYGESTGTGA